MKAAKHFKMLHYSGI